MTMLLYDAATDEMLDSAFTDELGEYAFDGLPHGLAVRVKPDWPGAEFDPPEATLTMDSPRVQDFVLLGFSS